MFGSNLVPWKKRRANKIENFQKRIPDLFERYMGKDQFRIPENIFDDGWFPSVDVSEGKKNITVKAEIPGMNPKDIDILLDDRRLRIKGEKTHEEEEKDKHFFCSERYYGYFNRTIELPAEVDGADVDASYKNGVLKIKLKKVKESEPKKIKIKAE